jgi:hypothetical protein
MNQVLQCKNLDDIIWQMLFLRSNFAVMFLNNNKHFLSIHITLNKSE